MAEIEAAFFSHVIPAPELLGRSILCRAMPGYHDPGEGGCCRDCGVPLDAAVLARVLARPEPIALSCAVQEV